MGDNPNPNKPGFNNNGQSVSSRSVMTADEQTLHRLIEHQRARGVPETSIVRALGLALGFGRLMQLTEQSWRELAVQRDVPGTEFTVGPCARELVPCPHPASSLNVNGHCDWCCGDGRVTARVRRAIKEVDSPTTGTEPVTHTEPAIQLVWYRRPDGRWNADCACGATVCGILEGERWTYEDWHLAHAQEERAHGQERQPCGPKLPDPNPNFPGPPVFR